MIKKIRGRLSFQVLLAYNIVIAALLIYIYLLPACKRSSFNQYEIQLENMHRLIRKTQNCFKLIGFSNQVLRDVWPKLPVLVQGCSQELYTALNVQAIANIDEDKFFILPFSPRTDTCNVITLGIGGDVSAEEKLLGLLPQCQFFGVDDDTNHNRELYQQKLRGKFYKSLVAVNNGTFSASILENGVYVDKTLSHISLKHILAKEYPHKLVDFLLMDIESAEFALMKDMIENPSSYPIICQMNIEFHNPYNVEQNVLNILTDITEAGQYLMIKSDDMNPFMRFFLINVKNEICLAKYLIKIF